MKSSLHSRIAVTIILVIASTLLTSYPQAHAMPCNIVSEIYEDYARKGQSDSTFGFRNRRDISEAARAYRVRWENPQCISDTTLEQIYETVLNLQQSCSSRKPVSMTSSSWKFNRKFYQGYYGKNFAYACQQWTLINLES